VIGVQTVGGHHVGQVGILATSQGAILDTSKLTSTGEQLPLSHHQGVHHQASSAQVTPGQFREPLALVSTPTGIAALVPLTTSTSTQQQASPAIAQPVTYSVAAAPISSTSSLLSGSTGGHHQESVGHHQVSHVTIPGQVGVGGGYTSSAFYEASPSGSSGVVIPSVPLSSADPIVASDVKINQKSVVDHHQTLGTGVHHQTYDG
jgi:hypothetical protein